ncbi:MAG TPA: type II secretion system F family protein [Acidimicrobiales bacterium]|nr:type II secretion system F family protein [Acidimicrobiales bacterium]
MIRLLVLAGLALWGGLVLCLCGVRRLSRPSLGDRLRPYHPGAAGTGRPTFVSGSSLRQVVAPMASAFGNRLAVALGVDEDVGVRLRRVHSALAASAFRTRQLGWSAAGLALAMILATAASLPAPLTALVIFGAPLLAFLVVEHRLSAASGRWQRRVLYELPVFSEQLAMLLAAGFSLGAAINRVADRGQGCCARDMATVANRVRQGVAEATALREWAEVARVPAVDRLVAVLALSSETSDLGRLVAAEARQVRREVHRRTMELIDRRSEQVWVPVTVATLVPGVILIAVPFLAALHTFSNA